MLRKILLLIVCSIPFLAHSQKFETRFEKSHGTQTPDYFEIINWWQKLDAASPEVKMLQMGPTDAGYPLHLILISGDKNFNIASLKAKGKTILFINNGIHPGEPDGIDASMLLAKNIVTRKYKLPANLVLAIIPVYNIGGCLNRSADYRVDQNGPEEFGFRGNGQNLDLDRDFTKCDSKNAISFDKIFHLLDPDVFIDNHVSDGADYQHVMTLLTTQHNKLGGEMGKYLNKEFEPALYKLMKAKGYDLIPYAGSFGSSPRNGWSAYWDSPRYGTGYASMWNTFGFMTETHMLKPYAQRVASTLALMECAIQFTSENAGKIIALRKEAIDEQRTQKEFPIAWELDKSVTTKILFKGYADSQKISNVSGLPRLYYDRNKPYEQEVPFYNEFKITEEIQKPEAYIIPQGWWKVTDRLQANNVTMWQLKKDSSLEVEWYRIEDFKSYTKPYEGHHPNMNIKISVHHQTMHFRKGDWYIPMNQAANRFLIETLEPRAQDSYFVWNFFDPVLSQKEGYSDYDFEDIAAEYLKKHPELQEKMNKKKTEDPSFAKSAGRQLNFVFENSPWIEPAYLQYPVFRVMK